MIIAVKYVRYFSPNVPIFIEAIPKMPMVGNPILPATMGIYLHIFITYYFTSPHELPLSLAGFRVLIEFCPGSITWIRFH